MISGSIARRYAKALLAIGVDSKQHETFGEELEQVARLLTHKELRDTLQNPSQPISKRKAILQALVERLGLSRTLRSFIQLLADRNRLPHIEGITREYQKMLDEHVGRVRANVTSPSALDGTEVVRLKQALEDKTHKKVILEQRTDPDLIAGMVTQVGSIIYDGSVRTRLQQMRQTLLEGEQ